MYIYYMIYIYIYIYIYMILSPRVQLPASNYLATRVRSPMSHDSPVAFFRWFGFRPFRMVEGFGVTGRDPRGVLRRYLESIRRSSRKGVSLSMRCNG